MGGNMRKNDVHIFVQILLNKMININSDGLPHLSVHNMTDSIWEKITNESS